MKRFVLLMGMVIMSCLVFSQVLTPVLHIQNKDTLFCFKANQAKIIAKSLTGGVYCDSIVKQQESQIGSLVGINKLNDERVALLKEELHNTGTIISNKNMQIKGLEAEKLTLYKGIQKQKRYRNISIVAAIVFGTIAIIH